MTYARATERPTSCSRHGRPGTIFLRPRLLGRTATYAWRPASGRGCDPAMSGCPATTAGRRAATSSSPATGTWRCAARRALRPGVRSAGDRAQFLHPGLRGQEPSSSTPFSSGRACLPLLFRRLLRPALPHTGLRELLRSTAGGTTTDRRLPHPGYAASRTTSSSVRLDLTSNRDRGYAPLPPRTLVQQNTIIQQNVTNVNVVNNNTTVVNNTTNNVTKNVTTNQMIAPPWQIAAAKGQKTVTLPPEARVQAKQESQQGQQAAMVQRKQVEVPTSAPLTAPRTTALSVPAARAASGQRPSPRPHHQPAKHHGAGHAAIATAGEQSADRTRRAKAGGVGESGDGRTEQLAGRFGTPSTTIPPDGQPGTLQKPPITAATTPPGTFNPATANPGPKSRRRRPGSRIPAPAGPARPAGDDGPAAADASARQPVRQYCRPTR